MKNEHTVEAADDDIRLDRWFKRHYPGFPHGMLEKNLRKGQIRVDGKKAKSSDRIRQGQVVDIKCAMTGIRQEEESPRRDFAPRDGEMLKRSVLYKDERLIVVNKPAGLAVQGGTKIDKSLDGMLDALAEDGQRPKLTHRLDRDTSGCLVLARNAKMANHLMHYFSARKIEKTYLALVNGLPDPLRGTIDLKLRKKDSPKESGRPGGPDGRDYEIMQVDGEEGQIAITEYRVLEAMARKFALVELKPLTGRTHQLRVHMQAIGCSIVGDHKYGGGTEDGAGIGIENKLHLHAWKITLPPFASGKRVEVLAPLPPHMQKSFKALGLDIPKK